MPQQNDERVPAAVRIDPFRPPPANVNRPSTQDKIVDEETATPVQTDHPFRLACGIPISRLLTPIVIEVKRGNEMGNQRYTADGPSDTCRR